MMDDSSNEDADFWEMDGTFRIFNPEKSHLYQDGEIFGDTSPMGRLTMIYKKGPYPWGSND